jgi:hypothetical protein
MNDRIEHYDEDSFANGQSPRDLRVSLSAGELEFQLVEAIDGVEDFLGFIRITARAIANGEY